MAVWRRMVGLQLALSVVGLGCSSEIQRVGRQGDPWHQTVGSVALVENLGAFPASRAANGLGWNLNQSSEVEFQAAHAAGAKWGRIQCGWAAVELQSVAPANTSLGFKMPADCVKGLHFATQYGISLTLVAGYGPPFHSTMKLALSGGAIPGARSLPVTFVSSASGQSLQDIRFPTAYVSGGKALSARRSYAGTLIQSVSIHDATHATLNLASALNRPLAAGLELTINEVLYPSPATYQATDPSVLAYARYVEFLGAQCAAAGIRCDVEMWNEPPWSSECWDNRASCFDTNPGYSENQGSPNWGFANALQSTTPPTGVTYTWAGTNKTGFASLLGTRYTSGAGAPFVQPARAITAESIHPYGNNPEDGSWNQPCLQASFNQPTFLNCDTIPSAGSNAVFVVQLTLRARQTDPGAGLTDVITETGSASEYNADEAHKARFEMRQYLAFLAGGIERIEFYRLFDHPSDGTNGSSAIALGGNTGYTPMPVYTALAGLVSDAAAIGATPVAAYAEDASGLTTVRAYLGSYPLAVVHLVGARDGDGANSELVVVYQRSSVTGACDLLDKPETTCWGHSPSPGETSVSLNVPPGMRVDRAVNLDTRENVQMDVNGSEVIVEVSDDPIELRVVPDSSAG